MRHIISRHTKSLTITVALATAYFWGHGDAKKNSHGPNDGGCDAAQPKTQPIDACQEMSGDEDAAGADIVEPTQKTVTLRRVTKQASDHFFEVAARLQRGDELILRIDSAGGMMSEAYKIIRASKVIREERRKIICYVRNALSASFLIAVSSCDKVFLEEHAELLWHAPYLRECGNVVTTLEDALKNADRLRFMRNDMWRRISPIFRSNLTVARESYANETSWQATDFMTTFNPPPSWELITSYHYDRITALNQEEIGKSPDVTAGADKEYVH